jgi:outer membrane lipoprotein LolB
VNRGRRSASALLACVTLVLAGCAVPLRPPVGLIGDTGPWSGRLALQVEESQSQSFSAGFELKGKAEAGELALFSPLGGTLALLQWAPGQATLRSNGQTRQFSSLDSLAAQVTGTPLPIAALFDWLAGSNTPVAGWQADLSQLREGRLQAKRVEPKPAADLRVVLDR